MSMVRWFLILVVLSGCGSPCPQIKDTRCSGSVVQVCGSNKKWQRVMDCSQIKVIKAGVPQIWNCSEAPGKGCTCVPGGK